MAEEGLVEVLDSPKFFELIRKLKKQSCIRNGVPIRSELMTNYGIIRQQYEDSLECFLKIQAVKQALAHTDRYSVIEALSVAEAIAESKLCDTQCSVVKLEESFLHAFAQNIFSELSPIARLLFPSDDSLDSIKDIANMAKFVELATMNKESKCRDILENTLIVLCVASVNIQILHDNCERLIDSVMVVAKKYVRAFSEYIKTVMASLDLKLLLVEMETLLVAYDKDCLVEYGKTFEAVTDLMVDLDQAISLGHTNLLLFRRLGPSLESLANHYQQILNQISLVKDDIAQLS